MGPASLSQMNMVHVSPIQMHMDLVSLTQMNKGHVSLIRMNKDLFCPFPFLSFLSQKSKDPVCQVRKNMGYVCLSRSHKDRVYDPFQMHMLPHVFPIRRNMDCACLFLHHHLKHLMDVA